MTETRNEIYKRLYDAYIKDPDSLNNEEKAALAILATTRYVDNYDKLEDIRADIYRRVEFSEKVLGKIEAGGEWDEDYIDAQLDLVEKLVTRDMKTFNTIGIKGNLT